MPQLRAWMIKLAKAVITASGRTDQKEYAWLALVQKEGSSADDFADSGGSRFETLDMKLSTALSTLIDSSPQAKKVNN